MVISGYSGFDLRFIECIGIGITNRHKFRPILMLSDCFYMIVTYSSTTRQGKADRTILNSWIINSHTFYKLR